mmetsp:Transcript_10585/g.34793  ORF Transcript_10585/g.34793 Transcript_10585/m.34793 type:complete len:301 (-) Transcript_10585:680-1582(-)
MDGERRQPSRRRGVSGAAIGARRGRAIRGGERHAFCGGAHPRRGCAARGAPDQNLDLRNGARSGTLRVDAPSRRSSPRRVRRGGSGAQRQVRESAIETVRGAGCECADAADEAELALVRGMRVRGLGRGSFRGRVCGGRPNLGVGGEQHRETGRGAVRCGVLDVPLDRGVRQAQQGPTGGGSKGESGGGDCGDARRVRAQPRKGAPEVRLFAGAALGRGAPDQFPARAVRVGRGGAGRARGGLVPGSGRGSRSRERARDGRHPRGAPRRGRGRGGRLLARPQRPVPQARRPRHRAPTPPK